MSDALSWTSAGFNILAAAFLICALIPGYLDAKKFRKTFFIEENFFKFFFFGAASMWVNAIVMLCKTLTDKTTYWNLVWMFIAFIISNSVSMFVNFYSWNMKRKNAAAAKNLGISEQEYWETHIAPTLESN